MTELIKLKFEISEDTGPAEERGTIRGLLSQSATPSQSAQGSLKEECAYAVLMQLWEGNNQLREERGDPQGTFFKASKS